MFFDWKKDSLSILDENSNMLAQIGFKLINNEQTFVVERTFVTENARGLGLAGKITTYFLDDVSQQKKSIIPLCSYTKSFIRKNPKYQILLAKDQTLEEE